MTAMRDMSDAEIREAYPQLIDFLANLVRPFLMLPLQEMAAANEHWQTVAPILEPTAYQRGGANNLRDQRRVIDAAAALQQVLLDLDPAHNQRGRQR